MSKNKHLFFLSSVILSIILFLLVSVNTSFAKISIVEIMYDNQGSDADKEWVKIVNDNETDYDISKIKLTINGSNHLIKDSGEATILNRGDSAILVDNPIDFKINYPNYVGKLFDSVYSLTNASGTVEIKYNDASIDSTTYDISVGASGDGNSLQKIDSVWKAEVPTIGYSKDYEPLSQSSNICTSFTYSTWGSCLNNTQNRTVLTSIPNGCVDGSPVITQSCTTSSTSSTTNTSSQVYVQRTRIVYVSSHSGTDDLSNYDEKAIFQVTAGRERTALVGAPLEFNAKHTLLQKDQCVPNFSWTFGDGFGGAGKDIQHTYKYAGEYQVILNGRCGDYNSASRTIVRVAVPSISISELPSGDTEIINKGKAEINIGNWKIKGGQKDFIFSRDTIISTNNKIILSKEDLNEGTSTEKVSINNPTDGEVAYYIKKLNPISPSTDLSLPSSSYMSVAEAENLVLKYKESLTANNRQLNVSQNTNEIIKEESVDKPVYINGVIQTASVIEAPIATSSKGFWASVLDIPVNSVKSFAHIFYDF